MRGTKTPKPSLRKKPASRVPAEAVQHECEPEIVSEPTAHVTSGLKWAMPTSCPKPAWALHFVRVLQRLGHLRLMQGKQLELSVWSDCSGINSEMFALRDISAAMREELGVDLRFNLHFTCDSERRCLEFASLNHKPAHTSSAMQLRNFNVGQYWCETHKENHDMPTRGLDVYVGTYPCSPWSRRGKRTGFAHRDAEVALIGLKSIAHMRPGVWIIEIGEMPSEAGMAELTQKILEMINMSGQAYTFQTIRHLTPATCGYPTRRTRTFIIGWRDDVSDIEVVRPLQCLIANTMSVESTYLAFLGMHGRVDWSRVGEYPSHAELVVVSSSACACGVAPWACCPLHPCQCGRCGEDGKSCAWRSHLGKFIETEGLAGVIAKSSGTLTYLQVLEMSGRRGPRHPRKRIYINLIALSPRSTPLRDTLMIVDISQNPPFGDLHCHGDSPTFTTSSDLWVFQAGEALRVPHCAALMGLDMAAVSVTNNMTEAWLRERLGLAVHIGSFGVVLLAALAPPLERCMR